MNKEQLLKFADDIKNEFFFRLKDETQPAKKEFSYIDLLNILDIVYKANNITKEEIEKFEEKQKVDIFSTMDPVMKRSYFKSLENENLKLKKQKEDKK